MRSLSDPRLSGVTVTEVRATQDLKEANVFWTVLDPRARDDAARAFESARGTLQGRIARELRTRETPHLRFTFDRHQDDAVALTRLIDDVARDLPPPDAADTTTDTPDA